MVESKRELCHADTGGDTDLDMRIDAARCFGWNVDSVTPYNRRNEFVISCSRDTEMKNYADIKKLDDEYTKKLFDLMRINLSVYKSKGKMRDIRILPTVVKVLSLLIAIFFLVLGSDGATDFIVAGIISALIFVLTIVLSNRKKSKVKLKYDELDELKLKAKSLL
ncbi:MAG: hypothetical protein R3Y60_00525 [bacterium]